MGGLEGWKEVRFWRLGGWVGVCVCMCVCDMRGIGSATATISNTLREPSHQTKQLLPPNCKPSTPRTKNLTPQNPHLLNRPIRLPRLDPANPLHNLHAINNMSKNRMRAVQMPRGRQRDEKLAAIGIRPRVGHAQDTRGGVREAGHDFVGEAAAGVDAGAAAAGAGRVAGLQHEVADDAVDGHGGVVACCGEGGEVVAGLFVGERGRGLVWWRSRNGVRLGLLTRGVCSRNRPTVMSPRVVWMSTRSGMSLGLAGTWRCSSVTLGVRSGSGAGAGGLSLLLKRAFSLSMVEYLVLEVFLFLFF